MRIYRLFNKLKRPRSYAGRVLLICFAGTHIPLITFAIWAVIKNPAFGRESWVDLLVLLLATLVGTAITFFLVHGMLEPVRAVFQALGDYRQNKQLPALPRNLSDEAGMMLDQVQDTLEELDLTLNNLARAAETDPLTEIGNRRWLVTRAEEQIARALRTQTPLCAVLFDLDRFKAINDRYGHAKGDAVLVGVARFVKGELRTSHLFARTGGEEFCIILPKTSLNEAVALATRIQKGLSGQSIARLDPGVVTASFGVVEREADEKDLSSLLRRADDLLYRAKNDGRNQVATSTPA
ncbi:MAG TPA: GGDEF domain-containing protein [Microvirga sp.]|nr:GGDEF domain-containing protein [Microvirga sp.]